MRKLIESIKDKKIKKIVKRLLLISFIIALLGILTIFIYYKFFISFNVLKLGVFIIQAGIVSSLFSVMCGVFFDDYLNYNENL